MISSIIALKEWLFWTFGGSYWCAEFRRDYILDENGRRIKNQHGQSMRGIRMTEVDYQGKRTFWTAVKNFACSSVVMVFVAIGAFTDPKDLFQNFWTTLLTSAIVLNFGYSAKTLAHSAKWVELIPVVGVDQTMSDDWDEGELPPPPDEAMPEEAPEQEEETYQASADDIDDDDYDDVIAPDDEEHAA